MGKRKALEEMDVFDSLIMFLVLEASTYVKSHKNLSAGSSIINVLFNISSLKSEGDTK